MVLASVAVVPAPRCRGRLGTATAAHAAGVPPVVLWSGDDRRTKQELVAWARAVASMVVRDYSMRC